MKKQIIPVVIAVIVNKDKFLMTKRADLDPEDKKIYHDAWQFVGGTIEFGETPEKALQREIKEELGIKVKIIKLIPRIYTEIRKNWQGIFIVYLCRIKDINSKIKLSSEASEYRWLSLNEAKKIKTLPKTIEMMKEALKICARGEI